MAEKRPSQHRGRLPVLIGAPLVVLERGAILLGAALVSSGRSEPVALVGVLVGVLYAARAILGTFLLRREEAHLRLALLDSALTERGAVDTASDSPLQFALYEGIDGEAAARTRVMPSFVGEGISAVGIAVVIGVTQPIARAGSLVAACVAAGAVALGLRALASRWARAGRDAEEAMLTGVLDGLLGRLDIVASGTVASYQERTFATLERWKREQARVSFATALLGRIPMALGVALGLGVVFALEPATPLAELAVLAAALPPIGGLLQSASELTRTKPARQRLSALLSTERSSASSAPPLLPAPIAIRGVSVELGATKALDGITCDLPERGLVVLAGPNGAGKSTLLRVLGRLVQPSRGDVRIGERDLAEVDGDAYRSGVATLTQRPYLPPGTVRDAMRFVAPRVDDAAMLAALGQLGVLRALESKDDAGPLDVSISALSIGERQRTALARVLVHPARFLLLDEPDANLDRAGIAGLLELLRSRAESGLVVVAAHTSEVIAAADLVLRLEGGKLTRG